MLRVLDKSDASAQSRRPRFPAGSRSSGTRVAYRKAYGTILVTGPTGSGKSTTLYATINILNRPERNLITVEDPVEYQLRGHQPGAGQPEGGPHFRPALRSILRSDPDVVLVGEIRDRETAMIAIEAALTGHLVLSSLHTNDAACDADAARGDGRRAFLVGSALDCVVAQRLARQLCENCARGRTRAGEELAADRLDGSDAAARRKSCDSAGVGCQACSRTGYRGRFAIHEMLLYERGDRTARSSLTSPTDEMQDCARTGDIDLAA